MATRLASPDYSCCGRVCRASASYGASSLAGTSLDGRQRAMSIESRLR